MLQSGVMHSRYRENVAHRLRRYIPLSVAQRTLWVRDLLPDVERSIPDIVHIANTTNKPIHLRLISAFFPPASCGVSSERLL